MSEVCEKCSNVKEMVSCWNCGGEGGHHDCGEDTCCCLDPYEVTNDCDICDGLGEYLVCPICNPQSFED